MILCRKVLTKEFSNPQGYKDTYLDVCKWIATNIISKVEVGDVLWTTRKDKKAELPTFILDLFINLDTKEHEEKLCLRCKEIQTGFYMTGKINCNECKLVAYRNQMDQRMAIKAQYRKEQIKRQLD